MENRKSLRSPCIPVYLHTCIPVLLGSFLFLLGCGKPQNDSDMVRRAQIVGNENLQLKREIVDKDKQIAELTAKSEQSKAELTQQLEQLKADNESLKKQYADAQQMFDKTVAEYQASMTTCQEQLDAKPTPCPEVEEKYAKLHGDLLNLLSECATKLEKYETQESEAASPKTE